MNARQLNLTSQTRPQRGRARYQRVILVVGTVMTAATLTPPASASTTSVAEMRFILPSSQRISSNAYLRGPGNEQFILNAEQRIASSSGARNSNLSSNSWTPIGPAPEQSNSSYGGANSGRVTGLAVSSGASPTLYLAAAGGGVWSSSNGGTSWATHSDSQPDIAMGSITVDPNNSSNLFAGTGENNHCNDCFYGDGVMESLNGGQSWITSNPGGVFTNSEISSIVVEPGAASISTTTVLAGSSSNLYVSNNGGVTWSREAGTGWVSGNVTSVVINSLTPSTTIYVFVRGVGVEMSADNGRTWSTIASFPSSGDTVSGALTIVPSASAANTVLYTSVVTNTKYWGFYSSKDGGSNWTGLPSCNNGVTNPQSNCVPYFTSGDYAYSGLNDDSGIDQGWYDNTIAVDPLNPNIIVAGGVTLVESTDGGVSWTNLNGGGFFKVAHSLFHPDFHALVFDASGNLYFGNDGGAWEMTAANVTSRSLSYINLNTNLDITQFYSGISQANNGATILGGTQDNGTLLYSSSSSPSTTWKEVIGGDGGGTAIDPTNPSNQIAMANISESDGSLYSTTTAWSTGTTDITPNKASRQSVPANWVAPVTFVPGTAGPTVLFGGEGVKVSTDFGSSWSLAATSYAGSTVSCIAVAPSNPLIIYAGYNDGTIQFSTDGGSSWANVKSPIKSGITHIAVAPLTPTTIYVTTATTYNGLLDGPGSADVEVATSTATSAVWTNVSGNLPTIPTSSVVPDGSGGLIVATAVGVYWTSSLNGADTPWMRLGSGLPNVQVMDVALTAQGTLVAFTHGRGAWTLSFSANGSSATTPGAPTAVAATAGNASASLKWTAPSSDGGSAVTGYTAMATDASTSVTTADVCPASDTAVATSCLVSGLTNGDSYTFAVAAINRVGTSAASSATSSVTPATVPGAPRSVTVRVVKSQITVSWSAPLSNGGSAITGYTAIATDASTSVTTADVCPASDTAVATSCLVSGLTNGDSYTFAVAAINRVGTSAASSATSSVTPATVPGAPRSVTVRVVKSQITVSWSAPLSNGGSAITFYTAIASPGLKTCTTTGATICTIKGLNKKMKYTIQVSASSSLGTGASSDRSAAVVVK
jgi:hypothetical protein